LEPQAARLAQSNAAKAAAVADRGMGRGQEVMDKSLLTANPGANSLQLRLL
jgi:hypothetical protein